MRGLVLGALSLALLSGGATLAGAETEHWLHVRVLDGEEKVSVNLPVELVATVIETAESDNFHRGRLIVEDQEFDRELVRAILQAAVESGDGEFVRVEAADGAQISVRKQKAMLLVDIDERAEDTQVRVSIPIAVVRAMLDGEGEALNIKAALDALGQHDGALVTIDDGDSTVRVWVDASMEGI
ncbi:hypothetical protein FJ251_08170 [bacterium]|nr:hypothetical protein [bacterium]